MVFLFSGDILNQLSLVHLVTLFAASFILDSALIGALQLSPGLPRAPCTCFLNFFDDIGHCDQKQGYA
jgi:hypothetical protein